MFSIKCKHLALNVNVSFFVCCIFILLTRESDGGAVFWTNAHPLRSIVHFRVFGCFFDFLPLNLLLVRSHQADIIIVQRLIQGRNNVYDEAES